MIWCKFVNLLFWFHIWFKKENKMKQKKYKIISRRAESGEKLAGQTISFAKCLVFLPSIYYTTSNGGGIRSFYHEIHALLYCCWYSDVLCRNCAHICCTMPVYENVKNSQSNQSIDWEKKTHIYIGHLAVISSFVYIFSLHGFFIITSWKSQCP